MRAQCPPYHRIPLHFRSHASLAPAQEPARVPMPRRNPLPATTGTLNASIHAPTLVAPILTAPTSSVPIRRGPGRPKGSKNKSKESTAGEDDDLPTQPEATDAAPAVSRRSRTSRSQQEMMRLMTDPERILHANNKRRRMVEPENVMEEDPDTDTDIWATQPHPQQQVAPTPTEDTQVPSHGLDLGIEIPSFLAFGSSPPQTALEEVATATNPTEIVDDEQFFEVSDGSDRSDYDDQDDQDNTDNE
jgi:hypothetical protein